MVEKSLPEFESDQPPMAYAQSIEPWANADVREWACQQCTLLNPIHAEFCNACMMQKPMDAPTETTNSMQYGEEPGTMENEKERAVIPYHQENLGHRAYVCNDTASHIPPSIGIVEEDPLRKKRRRRRRRRIRMVVGGTGGLIVGAIVFSNPAGLVFGTAVGAAGARYISKRRERKKDARVARALAAQENMEQSNKQPTFA